MKITGRTKGTTTEWIRNVRYRIRRAWFNVIGKNPYPDGSVGSLFWKIDHGKPLNEEERRAKDEWDELSRPIAQRLETSRRAQIYIGYAWIAGQLIRNLPKDMRDALARLYAKFKGGNGCHHVGTPPLAAGVGGFFTIRRQR